MSVNEIAIGNPKIYIVVFIFYNINNSFLVDIIACLYYTHMYIQFTINYFVDYCLSTLLASLSEDKTKTRINIL